MKQEINNNIQAASERAAAHRLRSIMSALFLAIPLTIFVLFVLPSGYGCITAIVLVAVNCRKVRAAISATG